MKLPHRTETYYVVSWSDFKDFVETTYGSQIFFPFDAERWHGEKHVVARQAVLQDEDREDLARACKKGNDIRQAYEVDNPLELVMTDLCNRKLIEAGNYLFTR